MRLLFGIDRKDYENCTRSFVRNSARSIIIRGGRVAMVRNLEYDYYKFPGGGIEAGETAEQAMIRETREEAGLIVIPQTIREYGYVHRIQRSDRDFTECFIQDNYYFLCEAEEETVPQSLEGYEAEQGFVLEWTEPEEAIYRNRHVTGSPYTMMFEREARVLEMLVAEGLFDTDAR